MNFRLLFLLVLLAGVVTTHASTTCAVICEGDSLTAGTGSTGGSNYVSQMNLNGLYGNYVTNIGHGGDVISANSAATDALTSLTNTIGYAKQTVVMMMQVNDIAVNDSVPIVTTNMLTWQNNVRAKFPNAKIMWLTSMAANLGTTLNARLVEVNTWLKSGTANIDYVGDLRADPRLQTFSDTTYYDPDGVHLNNAGYLVMATIVRSNLVYFNRVNADYYVRKDGSDSNTGTANTSGSAWLTIQKAANTMTAGDTVTVNTGIYSEDVSSASSGTSLNLITFAGVGLPDVNSFQMSHSWIAIQGFRISVSNAVYDAAIQGNPYATPGNFGNAHNIIVRSNLFDLHSVAESQIFTAGTNWLIYSNSFVNSWKDSLALAGQGHTITNNYFSETNGADLLHVLGDGITFANNLVSNWSGRYLSAGDKLKVGITYYFLTTNGAPSDFSNVGAGTWPYILGETYFGGHDGFTATGTTPNNWGGTVLDSSNHPDFVQAADYGYPSSTNIVIENNRFYYAFGTQLGNVQDTGNTHNIRNWVYRNNVFANVSFTMNLYAPGFSFYNNTFYRTAKDFGSMAISYNNSSYGIASNLTVFNNIFFECSDTPTSASRGWASGDSALNQLKDYNLVIGTGAGTTKDSSFTAGSQESHSLNGVNPLFVNASIYDFRLATNSPALAAGTNLNAIFTTDLIGATRGSTWSMGAYQTGFSGGDTTAPVCTIIVPSTSINTPNATVDLSGTASDNVGVTTVTWGASPSGGSGTATGTTTWSITGVPLNLGGNVVTVTAYDAAGNFFSAPRNVLYYLGTISNPASGRAALIGVGGP